MNNFFSNAKDPLTEMDAAERVGVLMILGSFELSPEQIVDLTRLAVLCAEKTHMTTKNVLDAVVMHLQHGEPADALIQGMQMVLYGPPAQPQPKRRLKITQIPERPRISRSRIRIR